LFSVGVTTNVECIAFPSSETRHVPNCEQIEWFHANFVSKNFRQFHTKKTNKNGKKFRQFHTTKQKTNLGTDTTYFSLQKFSPPEFPTQERTVA